MSMCQAGTININSVDPSATIPGDVSTFLQVAFPTPFPPGSTVIVIPMVQTFNGSDTPGVRIANVTNVGFLIRMNELVALLGALSNGTHVVETIGWVAFAVCKPFVDIDVIDPDGNEPG